MGRTLRYVDAVRLLADEDSELLARLETVVGGVVLAGGVVVPALLALLDAKSELARIGRDALRQLRRGRSSLRRTDRSRRIAAAHAVLVVTAYFEALAEADLPIPFRALELTAEEQLALVTRTSPLELRAVADLLLSDGGALPTPHGAHERYAEALREHYGRLSVHIEQFVSGLAVWDGLSATDRERFRHGLRQLPDPASQRYADHLRTLAADFPEIQVWLSLLEHEATREAVRGLEPSLARLERALAAASTGALPAGVALSVARANQAALTRPIAESGDVPAYLSVPTLQRSYLPPRYRVTEHVGPAGPHDEEWWETIPVEEDLDQFLERYLSDLDATTAPMLVLGQPGAGKSVLTRVLAARLPSTDFVAVRVPLRDVAAEADIQAQIEQALHQATGERIAWPALVRANPGALPVVLIDGFDELLQATGVRQTDYLLRVADFQRREADQGRPVVVLVTTRTSVADRAQRPPDTLLLRLEPFDRPRIQAWVDIWNEVNADNFARAAIRPLDLDAVVARAELAGQPLLLLMLALYDADGNALRRLVSGLRPPQLYEQLLTRFAEREVAKLHGPLPPDELRVAVEEEMRRLSIVAFAIFNRLSQWVTEADLERDLVAIYGPPRRSGRSDLRTPMGAAESVLGRFFFVHRAQAQTDLVATHTYEFLHATFGEYLVARLTWQVARDTAARHRASTLPTGGIDDELLYALLSFAALPLRRPVVEFLADLAADLPDAERRHLGDLLLELFRTSGLPGSGRVFSGYVPRQVTVSNRHAAYSLNTLLLAVLVRGSVLVSEVYGETEREPVEAWHSHALLWQSQLVGEFWTLWHTIGVERFWNGAHRDIRLSLPGSAPQIPPVDPQWTYDVREQDPDYYWSLTTHRLMERRVNFMAGTYTDIMWHALEPFVRVLGVRAVACFFLLGPPGPGRAVSMARAAIEPWLLALADGVDEDERSAVYRRAVRVCLHDDGWSSMAEPDAGPTKLASLLVRALSTDRLVPFATAAEVIETLLPAPIAATDDVLLADLARAILALLNDDPDRRTWAEATLRGATDLWPAGAQEHLIPLRRRLAELEPAPPQ